MAANTPPELDEVPTGLTELEYVLLHFSYCLPPDTSPLWKHEIPEGEKAEGEKLQAILSHAWEELLEGSPEHAFVMAVKYGGPDSGRYNRALEYLQVEDVRDIFGKLWTDIPDNHKTRIILDIKDQGYNKEVLQFLFHPPDCLPSDALPRGVDGLVDEGKEGRHTERQTEGKKLQAILDRTWDELLETNPAEALFAAVTYGTPGSDEYEEAAAELSPEDVKNIFHSSLWDYIPNEHYNGIIIDLKDRGYYEEVLQFMGARNMESRKSFGLILGEFIEESPADAFVYISQHWIRLSETTALPDVIAKLKKCIHGTRQEAAEILKAYERIDEVHDFEGERTLKNILTKDALQEFPLRAELYQLCLERNDSFYWDIGRSMLDEETIDCFPDEARVLAYEAGEKEPLENLEGASLVPAYRSLIREAQDIVRLVSRQYGVELPKRIEVGGPTGSYASIRTKGAGLPDITEEKGNTLQEEVTNDGLGA